MKIILFFALLVISFQLEDIITNGDFSEHICTNQNKLCRIKSNDPATKEILKGWEAEPEFIFYDGVNTNTMINFNAVGLQADKTNGCIKQKIPGVLPAIYKIRIVWYAKSGFPWVYGRFGVYIDGKLIKDITPNNYLIKAEKFDHEITKLSDIEFKICGIGNPFSYITNIMDVRMTRTTEIKSISNFVNTQLLGTGNPTFGAVGSVNPTSGNTISANQASAPNQNPAGSTGSTGLTLDSHSGKCLEKNYILEEGDIEILFDYKVSVNFAVKDSTVYVILDGQPIYKVCAQESGKTIKLQGKITKGPHMIGFCAIGSPNQNVHQIFISNIAISVKTCRLQFQFNQLINEDFETNPCKTDRCVYTPSNLNPDLFPGWQSAAQVSIVRGRIQNECFLPQTWVAQLDMFTNNCVSQRVNVRAGLVQIQFDWAAKAKAPLDTSNFDIKLGGTVLKKMIPKDYTLQQENLEFNVNFSGSQWLEFCATGRADSLGAAIDNVSFANSRRNTQCQTVKY